MFKILKRMNRKSVGLILICIVFIVFQVWLDLRLPDYMSNITKLVQTEGSQMSEILEQGGYMILCALGSLASAIIVGYFASYIAASFSKQLRRDVFYKVENFGMEELKKFSTSSLLTRTTNDITQIQMLIVMGLQLTIKAPITAVWAVSKIAGKNMEWTVLTGGAVLVLILFISILIAITLPKTRKVQELTDNLNRVTRENLKGIRVVRAFNAEEYQEAKFNEANEALTKTNLFVQRMMGLMTPLMQFVMSGISLGIYIIGAYLINAAGLTDRLNLFSDMVVFSSYSMQVIMAFMMLIVIFIILPRAQVSANRILEVLNTEEKIKDGTINKTDGKVKGKVEFRDVSFQYPDADEPILEHISFTAEKGETVAFIGSTGSGKSTLINLVPRFYDVTEGEVLVDDINVKDYTLEALHNKLGYIPQKAVLFRGTIESNVTYGKTDHEKPNQEKVKEAIRVAQASEFVEKKPEKYQAPIAQGGSNVSGGQKQRLAIARAIARDPEIYIFDDSFSALDYKTDFVLRKELKEYTKEATTLIVAQRIGTVKNADKIIVLDEGKMVGCGTHEELLKTCKVYQEIALSQLSKEELENG